MKNHFLRATFMPICRLEVVWSMPKVPGKVTAVQGSVKKAKTTSQLPSAITAPALEWVRNLHPATSMRSWLSTGIQDAHEPVLKLCPSDYSTRDHHPGQRGSDSSHHLYPQNPSHQAMTQSVLLALGRLSLSDLNRSVALGDMVARMWICAGPASLK